jgi:hypothetical protein
MRYSLVFFKILMLDGSNLMNDWVRLLKIDNCLFSLLEIKISKKVLRKQ